MADARRAIDTGIDINRDYIIFEENILDEDGGLNFNNPHNIQLDSYYIFNYVSAFSTKLFTLKFLLQLEPWLKKSGQRYCNPVSWAILHNNRHFIQPLIDAGADVNEGYVYYEDERLDVIRMPLMYGAMMDILVKNGAHINVTDEWGFTTLMYACVNQNITTIKYLLENNVDINVFNDSNKTVLDDTYSREVPYKIIKLLKKHGAKKYRNL